MSDPDPDSVSEPVPPLRDRLSAAGRTLAIIAKTRPGLTLGISVLTVVAALLPPAALYVSKLLIDGVVAAIGSGLEADRNAALRWVVVEAGLLAVLLVVRRGLVFQKARLHAELGFAVARLILDKANRFALAQIEHPRVQEMLIHAKQFAAARPYGLIVRGFDSLQAGVTLISIIALLAASAPWLILLMLVGGLPAFLGNLRFSGDAYRFYTARSPQMRERNYLESLVTNEAAARERLHYGLGDPLLGRFSDLFNDMHDGDRRLQGRQAVIGSLLGIGGSAIFLGGKLWIVVATIAGRFSLGDMTMLIGLLKQGQNAVNALLAAFTGSHEDLLYVTRLFALLDLDEGRTAGLATEGPTPGDGLRFENVSFAYPGASTRALDRVSFQLAPGTRLGLVGVNGSGKTTLVKLAAGLYRPDTGRVLLDGLDLAEWDPAALSRRIGVMFQPHVNYKLSVRDNVESGIGLATLSPDAMDRALAAGLARELVDELENGVETRLSKRFAEGVELSGGQWQRLAMARAHANEAADILILDEPTAALDAEAESAFMARPLAPGRSLILISHRLSNLRTADLIILLDQGCVAEVGDHETLIGQGGAYANLFALQADPYRT
ncbi:ABC transporter ATP-binding protein [Maricaulis maris]|uniref:ATP-binding cassette subfamily B protein/ATP-binding cassette subfamily C protein n=1 Tax=Maricaulis maris TaxID=74318 RepID=A0A495D3P8_9PROT|nr:ABC transporter ATP-binding protein [Maricaulis maris]RKQ95379.1 ATP-binding cassette subfamily B protein/ATP-binding cassette subfamily C protein [Maricaulis maris]